MDTVSEAFNRFDKDGSGSISRDELAEAAPSGVRPCGARGVGGSERRSERFLRPTGWVDRAAFVVNLRLKDVESLGVHVDRPEVCYCRSVHGEEEDNTLDISLLKMWLIVIWAGCFCFCRTLMNMRSIVFFFPS